MFAIRNIFYSALLFAFSISHTFSQEIKNDTINTSTGVEVSLYFHDKITFCDYIDQAAYNRFIKKQIDDKSVSIVAKVKNAEPAKLKVTEGNRSHLFILAFREGLDNNELVHDFEDLKRLKDYVTEKDRKKSLQLTPAIAGTAVGATPQQPALTIPKNEKAVTTLPGSETYEVIIKKAYGLFKAHNYEESRDEYYRAIALNPNDKIARDQIVEIDRLLNEKLKNKEYTDKLAEADKAFSEQKFEEAEQLYKIALNINPDDVYAKNRLGEVQKKIEDFRQAKIRREKEANFQRKVLEGENALHDKKYEDAKAAFLSALEYKPNNPICLDRIKSIDKILKDLAIKQDEEKKMHEREDLYLGALAIANDAYNSGKFTVAKIKYKEALTYKKDQFIIKQLETIDKQIADSIKQAYSEQVAKLKEKQNKEFYEKHIKKADQAFALKKYGEAKMSYQQALTYQDDSYPKERISEIEKIENQIAEGNRMKEKYEALLVQGKAALNKGDLNKAKTYFEEARELNSTDVTAKEQLLVINLKLEELTKQKEINDHYDTCISRAAVAINVKDYKMAQDLYKEAGVLKPQETYPTKMIVYLENLLLEEADRRKNEELAMRRRKIINLKTKAVQSIVDKDWKAALRGFEEIVALNPPKQEEDFAKRKISDIKNEIRKSDSITALQAPVATAPTRKLSKDEIKRNKIAEEYRAKQEKIRQDTIAQQKKRTDELKKRMAAAIANNSYSINNNRATADVFGQDQAIPYAHAELLKKYPEVNFELTPPDQTYDATDRKNRSLNFEISKKVLADTSDLNLYDSVNSIKATCKSISFSGDNAFMKISIKNNSFTDFLAGAMQLKIIKKNNSTINLDQRFISDFPIILPQKEFSLVYVSNGAVNVEPGDKVIMEVSDRARKIKLRINIPANIYNMQKTAKM